jgi:hypothetical protein
VGFRVWAEGLAVAGTRLLCPEHDDAAYFFVPDRQWIHDCQAGLGMVAPFLLDHLNNTDAKVVDALCGATPSHPWPNRVG